MRLRPAAVVACLFAGCGSGELPPAVSDAEVADAGPADAAADAAIDAARAASVTVEVHEWVVGGGPVVAGARVRFLDHDGATASETTTDVNGLAAGVVPPAGSVLVIDSSWAPFETELTSFYGVEDGEHLRVSGPHPPSLTSAAGELIVPAGPAGTSQYEVVGRCVRGSSSTTTIPLALGPGCAPGPRDLMVAAYVGGHTYVYLPVVGADVRPGTTITATDPWHPAATFHSTYGGVLPSQQLALWTYAIDHGYSLIGSFQGLPPPAAGMVVGDTPHPLPMGDWTFAETDVRDSRLPGGQWISRYLPGYQTDLAIPSVADVLLPWISTFSVTAAGASWKTDAGRDPDGVYLRIYAWIGAPLGPDQSWDWRIYAPAGTHRVTLPPVEGWGSFDGISASVHLLDSSAVDGHRQFLEHASEMSGDISFDHPPDRLIDSWMNRIIF